MGHEQEGDDASKDVTNQTLSPGTDMDLDSAVLETLTEIETPEGVCCGKPVAVIDRNSVGTLDALQDSPLDARSEERREELLSGAAPPIVDAGSAEPVEVAPAPSPGTSSCDEKRVEKTSSWIRDVGAVCKKLDA